MKRSNVYSFLEASNHRDLVVRFRDGDAYPVGKLDLCKSVHFDDEPIHAMFSDCLNRSNAWEAALRTKPLEVPGVIWTSDPPIEPIGFCYGVEDIASITDVERGFDIYEADA